MSFFSDELHVALILFAVAWVCFLLFAWGLCRVAARGDAALDMHEADPWTESRFTDWDCENDLKDAA